MKIRQSAYSSPTYEAYNAIDQDDWHNIVRFCEEHQAEIRQLEFGEFFELLLAYTNALFEIGKYQKLLSNAERILLLSIQHNIQYFKTEDIYQKTLFQKSVAHYYLQEYEQAEYTLRELSKINPDKAIHKKYLTKCLRKRRPDFVLSARAFFISTTLSASLLFFLKILLVDSFWNEWSVYFGWGIWLIFLLGFGILLVAELSHEYAVRKTSDAFFDNIMDNKNRNPSE